MFSSLFVGVKWLDEAVEAKEKGAEGRRDGMLVSTKVLKSRAGGG